MRSEVYSWRLTPEVKSDLERQARLRNISVSSILDIAVRDWLKKNSDKDEEEIQARLHAAAERCFGTIVGRDPHRAESARKIVRNRLRRRYGR